MSSKKLERLTKSAKSQRRKLRDSEEGRGDYVVGKIREEPNQCKQEEVLVWGPYADGPTRFRLKISEREEVRSVSFKTKKEAETVKTSLLKKVEPRQECTIGEAVALFCRYLTETRCIKDESVKDAKRRLAWLPEQALLSSVTPEQAEKLYLQHAASGCRRNGRPISVATHRAGLDRAKDFFTWSQHARFCRQNPFALVQPFGRVNVGKKQLRIDEARRFEAVCLKQAQGGDIAALGALLMLYLGLRQSEVRCRIGRDIDDDGRVLWVPSGKTKNAKRRLKIPEHLRPLLLKLIANRGATEWLFYPQGRKQTSHYYVGHVGRLCSLAEVPIVCPHSLRGLHATLALEGGATADSVAKALGHGSFAMTAKHYATESSVGDAKTSRVTNALADHLGPTIELERLLNRLPPERLPDLLIYLRSQCGPPSHLDDKFQT